MSTTTQSTVLQNAAYHTQLLDTIAALDYVPSALRQQKELISGFKAQRQQTALTIAVLEKKTKKERKEHEALRDSTARRLAHKLTGQKDKFQAKASKEEREYVEALEKEMQEKRQMVTLETVLSEAEVEHTDLINKLEIHKIAKQDLAALYSQIFDGVTRDYPEDDRLEEQLQAAQAQYDEIQGQLNQESQAYNLLHSADRTLAACRSAVSSALGYSQWDMWGGGTMSDMMERDALNTAEGHAKQAAMFVRQAQSVSPYVQPIGEVSVAQGSILSDVIFDNIFSDMAFHDKIKATQRNVEAVQYNLTSQLTTAEARTNAIGAELNGAAERLTQSRAALNAFRRNVFDQLTGSGEGNPAMPPAYDPQAPALSFPDADSHSQNGYAPPPGPPPSFVGGFSTSGSASSPAPQQQTYTPPLGPPPPAKDLQPSPGFSTSGPASSPAPQPQQQTYTPPPGPPPPPAKDLQPTSGSLHGIEIEISLSPTKVPAAADIIRTALGSSTVCV
ncbi:hypothetical protein FB45DRAFT_1040309 [Roridomyces roridus]|uniref:Uncharacterized protein n=1 Tax=Roridomyces roridus TaxID=1738132 RepID=A0AAD7B1P6_9AGAR|nr:hypothetical protein FB45DRAFT_1040309 [Roridomyces roridus]